MCSTCDYTKYETIIIELNGRSIEKLERRMGYGRLIMRCDPGGKKYTLGVKDEPNSDVRIYRCPTCGHQLFD